MSGPEIKVGARFGLLIVLSRDGTAYGRKAKWFCQCHCGNSLSVRVSALLSGAMRSCGCQSVRARRGFRRVEQRFALTEARKQLAVAQTALKEATDAELITSARHAVAEALKRVQDLKDWRALAKLGKGRPTR